MACRAVQPCYIRVAFFLHFYNFNVLSSCLYFFYMFLGIRISVFFSFFTVQYTLALDFQGNSSWTQKYRHVFHELNFFCLLLGELFHILLGSSTINSRHFLNLPVMNNHFPMLFFEVFVLWVWSIWVVRLGPQSVKNIALELASYNE